MSARREGSRVAVRVVVYVAFWWAMAAAAGYVFAALLDYLPAIVLTSLGAAVFANWVVLRIYEQRPLADIGLWWDGASMRNMALGMAGGAGAAALVLAGPLAFRVAQLKPTGAEFHPGALAFATAMLLAGAAGEEILFRGYGFQLLVRALGPVAAVLPVGVLFALLHTGNPNATWLAIANTAGFGVLFGFAYLRSRDLWLPIGLHFGWNFTLPLFGVNVSGLKIGVTGYAMEWAAGALWSGGAYGPEASLLTSAVLVVLFAFIQRAPFARRPAPLLDPPTEEPPCAAGPR